MDKVLAKALTQSLLELMMSDVKQVIYSETTLLEEIDENVKNAQTKCHAVLNQQRALNNQILNRFQPHTQQTTFKGSAELFNQITTTTLQLHIKYDFSAFG